MRLEEAIDDAWKFVKDKLVSIKQERGVAGVWSMGFRTGWEAAERKDVASLDLDAALFEYRRWMPGHSGRIGSETFWVCRQNDLGEVEWLARHDTAEAMREDLDKRIIEAVLRAALNP